MISVRGKQTTRGFTIIELLIATAVFSLVLLGALAGFLRTGNLFYKGVSLTQTQAAAKQIMDDVSANVSNSNGVGAPNQNPSAGYTYYCVGNIRYTYNNQKVDSNNPNWGDPNSGGNYGVIKDNVNGCPAPCGTTNCMANDKTITGGTELLADNMHLSEFLVCNTTGNLWNINIIVAYGDPDTPDTSEPSCANPSFNPPSCNGSTQSQQFCAVSTLSSSVYAGLSL